jgi:hypothetical protein
LVATFPFAGRASAQSTVDRPAADSGTANARTYRDEGTNYGWLGLLGLAGLAGLMPRKSHAVTTHRVGEVNAR